MVLSELHNTQVVMSRCSEYSVNKIKTVLDRAIDSLGGWGKVLGNAQTVMLKPNLLRARPPEYGITTHPFVIRAIIELIFDRGPYTIFVGDSSGERFRRIDTIWEKTGMMDAVKGTGAKLIAFDKACEVAVPHGKIFKKILIAKPVLEADVLISVPKLKTHDLTILSGGVKNLLGTVPGLFKLEFHKNAPHASQFGEAIADLFSLVRPQLTIMDGIVGMEGDGPVSPYLVKTNMLITGFDAVAVDAVASRLIGVNPEQVPTTKACSARGLGIGDLDYITISGGTIKDFLIPAFKLPTTTLVSKLPSFMVKLIGHLVTVKPAVKGDMCTHCGFCSECCFAGAVLKQGQMPPVFDPALCTTCMCCYELCPEQAIYPKKSLLAKLYFSPLKSKIFQFIHNYLPVIFKRK